MTFESADNASLRPVPTWSLADAGAACPVKIDCAIVLIPEDAESKAVEAEATAVASVPLKSALKEKGGLRRCSCELLYRTLGFPESADSLEAFDVALNISNLPFVETVSRKRCCHYSQASGNRYPH